MLRPMENDVCPVLTLNAESLLTLNAQGLWCRERQVLRAKWEGNLASKIMGILQNRGWFRCIDTNFSYFNINIYY